MSNQTTPYPKQTPQRCLKNIAIGLCMGAADVIPGVSGGTMAFILGVYEELINAIRTITSRKFWESILHLQINDACTQIHAPFLLCIGTGIFIAVLLVAGVLENALETHPLLIWSFFFGLVLASAMVILHRVEKWHSLNIAWLVIGIFFALLLTGITPTETPNTWWFIILSGAIAICAMILPGISGAFLLVLLGKYQFALSAVHNHDIVAIALLGTGAIIGLLLFSDVVHWLLTRFRDRTIVTLCGLMFGSLRRIWPWKSNGITSDNILPQTSHDLWIGIAVILLGAMLVFTLEYIAHHRKMVH